MENKFQQNADTLFTDNFPIVNSDIELEKMKQKFSKYDPYYVVSGCTKERREKFDALWQVFNPYCDSHFLEQYKNKSNFHKRTWEMYTGCILLKNNMHIQSLDEGPDFIVDGIEYIECVAVSKGDPDKPNSVPEMFVATTPEEIRAESVPVDKMILRITSAVKDKYEKYKNWTNIDKNKPYIIVLNTSELDYPQDYLGIPLVIRALFGLHFLQITQNGKKSFSWRQNVSKINTLIPVNNFTNDLWKEISGVIFSDKNVLNHSKINGEDCVFINNPFAANPVNPKRYSFLKNWCAKNNELIKLY